MVFKRQSNSKVCLLKTQNIVILVLYTRLSTIIEILTPSMQMWMNFWGIIFPSLIFFLPKCKCLLPARPVCFLFLPSPNWNECFLRFTRHPLPIRQPSEWSVSPFVDNYSYVVQLTHIVMEVLAVCRRLDDSLADTEVAKPLALLPLESILLQERLHDG